MKKNKHRLDGLHRLHQIIYGIVCIESVNNVVDLLSSVFGIGALCFLADRKLILML